MANLSVNYEHRITQIQNRLSEQDLGALFVHSSADVRWLTGFAGSVGYVLITDSGLILFVDSRYFDYANQLEAVKSDLVKVVLISTDGVEAQAKSLLIEPKLSFSLQDLAVIQYKKLLNLNIDLAELKNNMILEFRLIKDQFELEISTKALNIAEQAFVKVKAETVLPVTEKQFQQRLDAEMILLGADRPGFETIVASGPNSVQPHGHPTNREIQEGEFVVVDWGAEIDGYRSDTSRTIWWGKISAEQQHIYDSVKKALDKATEAIKPGVSYGEVMATARSVLAEADLDSYIQHPFGHNIGLEIHERPYFSDNESALISKGNLVALEPAVYVPNLGGVRLENMIYVEDKAETLNTLET